MSDPIYSVCVWHRRSARARWRVWQRFASWFAAAEAIRAAKQRGQLAGETLTVLGDVDPNVAVTRKGDDE